MASKLLFLILTFLTVSDVFVMSQLIPLRYSRLSEDGRLTYPELAKKYGHPATTHEVTTDDGYILTVYRLPGKLRKVVLLIHGNTPTADCWIGRGKRSLAITLADLGYDVWAINTRGTRYSRKHISLDPETQPRQFFNYSFYEQAIYDVPATIDYILKKTKQKSLIAIGHSVGTTLIYIMGAEKPVYNKKIKISISLAPISFIQHVGILKQLNLLVHGEENPKLSLPIELILGIVSILNNAEVVTHDGIGSLLRLLCIQPLGYELCIKRLAFPIMGNNPDGLEPEFVSTFFGHYPGGSTTKIFHHLAQVVKRNKFAKFDYGERVNLQEYGQSEPPEFDLSKVTMKTAIFLAENDLLGTVKDGERLNASLPNVVYYQVHPDERFNHVDFVWGRHMPENLFPYLLDVIKKHE